MELKVRKITGVEKTIRAPPSKSYTHRAFVVASLAEGRSDIKTCLKAGDTLSTLEACRAFGVAVEEGKHVTIHGCGGKLKTPRSTINCGNSGTTIRLISGMAALDGKVKLTGDESVKARPMQPLLDALNQFGVRAISEGGDGKPPVIIKGGRLLGGTVKIEGGISSQFISSLLLIAPYAAEDIEILLLSRLKSRPYVDITLDVMQKFGGVAENEDYNRFVVEAGATYKGQNYWIEGDYSAASYFLALAAMTNSKITVKNLARDSKQGDVAILDILKEMGAGVKIDKEEVTVEGKRLEGVEVDLGDSPDLLPTLAALGCAASGRTIINNVAHARYKETDRLSACAKEFRKFGAKVNERKDGLSVEGGRKIVGARVKSYNDHRMAMALAVLGMAAEGSTIVEDAECASISFPEFQEIVASLYQV